MNNLRSWILHKKQMPVLFAVAFAIIGGALLVFTRAATTSISIEAENGTRVGNVSEVGDSTASGSKAVLFNATAIPSPTPSTTPEGCTVNVTTATFASAVASASSGQVLCLAAGNYGEWGGTNKAIAIRPQAGASPTISVALRNGDCCFTIDGGRSTLDTAEVGLIINNDGGPSIGAGVTNVTIKNTRFTSEFRIDGTVGSGGLVNANILFDHNVHSNLASGAAIALSWGQSQPSGVTVQNSMFRDMGADGIQTGTGMNVLNNEFWNIAPNNPDQHTDALQTVGGGNMVIRGNYFHEGEQAIGMFDGTGNNIIEHNVIKNFTAHWITLGGDRPASVVQFNTIVGTGSKVIACGSKAGYQPSLTIIRNNIVGGFDLDGTVPCSATEIRNNLITSGGAYSQNFNGVPIFAGGSNPSTFLGYLLAAGSPGKGAATDGSDVGVHQQ